MVEERNDKRNTKPHVYGTRKVIPIDWDKVDSMLEAGCLGTEIAAYFECSPSTFYNRCWEVRGMQFSDYSREKKDKGNTALRIKQWEKAILLDGDRGMLIWLGKQRIGQSDNPVETREFNGKLSETLDLLKSMKQASLEKDKPIEIEKDEKVGFADEMMEALKNIKEKNEQVDK